MRKNLDFDLEKAILMGRPKRPSEEGSGIDVSRYAKANGLQIPTEITPAVEAMLMDIPVKWKAVMDFDSRLNDLLFVTGENLKKWTSSQDISQSLVTTAQNCMVFSLNKTMQHMESCTSGVREVETAWFLVEMRKLREEKRPEAYQVTIGLDLRHHRDGRMVGSNDQN